MTTTIKTLEGAAVEGVRIVDMPDLGTFTDNSSLVGEHAGSGRFSAPALRSYVGSGIVNVLDYGARGDGVADDTAAIQATLNAYAGKAIVLVPDTGQPYMVSGLSLPTASNMLLHGVIKLLPDSPAGVVTVTGADDVILRGLGAIDGNSAAQLLHPGGMAGLAVHQSSNVQVSGIRLTNAYNWNLNVTQSDHVTVDAVTMTLGGAAAEFADGSTDCWLTNSLIDGTSNGDYGFAFYGGVTNSGAVGNVVKNAGAGTGSGPPGIGVLSDAPQPAPCSNIVIADNICHNNAGSGIAVLNEASAGGFQTGIVIANNRCYSNCAIHGTAITSISDICLDFVADVTITGNQLSANGNVSATTQFFGIYVSATSSHVAIVGNQISNVGKGSSTTTSAAIAIAGANHVYVGGNYAYDTQTTPTMASSLFGTAGTNNGYMGNFFGRPVNITEAADTLLASATTIGGAPSFVIGKSTRLTIAQAQQYRNAAGAVRWYVGGTGTESGGNTGSDFSISSVMDDNTSTLQAILVERATGLVTFSVPPRFFPAPFNATTDAAAAAGGVSLHGIYRNGNVLMVRLT